MYLYSATQGLMQQSVCSTTQGLMQQSVWSFINANVIFDE